MNKDLEEYLEKAKVPDPGESYWKAFPEEVVARLENDSYPRFAEPLSGRKKFHPIFLTAAVAALIMLISLLVRAPEAPRTPAGESYIVEESEKTAKLALDSAPEGILQTLEAVALEKANRAQAAFQRGDWLAVAPLARSYGKILTNGLLRGIERALEDEEDLADTVHGLMERVAIEKKEWMRMAASVQDENAQEALESAIDASDMLLAVLEARF